MQSAHRQATLAISIDESLEDALHFKASERSQTLAEFVRDILAQATNYDVQRRTNDTELERREKDEGELPSSVGSGGQPQLPCARH